MTEYRIKRREFLQAAASPLLLPLLSWAGQVPRDLKITRIVGFDLISKRPKKVGKNSRKAEHGITGRDRVVRLFTNTGIEGVGNCRADQNALGQILGRNPFEYYQKNQHAMTSPLGAGTMPLWDLIGKVLQQPVYKLLGGKGPKRVPVYDGSIYFNDLMKEHQDRYIDRFKEEIDMSLALGHRAVKVKIGRGAKWMPTEEGYQRDVEILKNIRKHAGPKLLIGVDANNGYNPEQTRRLLLDLPDLKFAFLEEMFHEDVDQYLKLKKFIKQHNWQILIADGETQSELKAYKPFIKSRAVDIFQGDMNRFGIEGIMTEASWCKPQGLMVAPHNWGSLIGFIMQLHVGRAITNFYRAEHDPQTNSVLSLDGYKIKDGFCSVPDAPGFGLKIQEDNFRKNAKIRFEMKA